MNPEIRRYLDEHGTEYTPEALRRALLDAGYDQVEVDTALREWQARATEPAAADNERRRFWWWALGLHAAVLVLIGALSLAIGSFAIVGWLILILALVLLIGLGISGRLGRAVLRGRGMTTALLVPAISALLIGGSCLALAGSSLLRQPPKTGVMDLLIKPPLSFDGSGVATCQDFGDSSGFVVDAQDLGTFEGKLVSVSLSAYVPKAVAAAPAPPPGTESVSLYINFISESAPGQTVTYSNIFSSRVELDSSSTALSGTLQFAGLEPGGGKLPPGGVPGLEPISGTISWTCK